MSSSFDEAKQGARHLVAELRAMAWETRIAFEAGCFDVPIARKAYADYAPNVDIDRFLMRSRSLFPALNCGLCSTYLRAKLRRGTVRRGYYDGERHAVLVVGPMIVDITADQFGGPPVYVGPLIWPWMLPNN